MKNTSGHIPYAKLSLICAAILIMIFGLLFQPHHTVTVVKSKMGMSAVSMVTKNGVDTYDGPYPEYWVTFDLDEQKNLVHEITDSEHSSAIRTGSRIYVSYYLFTPTQTVVAINQVSLAK